MSPEDRNFIENLFRSLERRIDGITVDTGMVLRHETRIKEHAEWLRDHEVAMARHDAMMAKHDAMMAEIDAKLDRLADLMLKGRGTNGEPNGAT
jgi:hypothetical protein